MTFHNTNNLRLEVEVPTDGLPNLLANPSGEKGAWSWITPVANTSMLTTTVPNLTFLNSATQAAYFTSDFLTVAAGKYVAARFDTLGGTSGYNVKARFEWYNSSKVLLSSSTQTTGFTNTVQTNYVPAVVAPTSTAYVKLRFDFYNGTSNPGSNTSYLFKNAMVTWADTSAGLGTTRTNLLTNPSFEGTDFASGWEMTAGDNSTPSVVRTSTITPVAGTISLRATSTGIGNMHVWLQDYTVTGGKTYTFSAYFKAASLQRNVALRMAWYDSKGVALPYTQKTVGLDNSSTWTRYAMTATAPSKAVKMTPRLIWFSCQNGDVHYADAALLEKTSVLGSYFDGSTTATGKTYGWSGTANASTSTEVTASYGFSDPHDWQNILGPVHELNISRGALDVGLLTATVLDPLLDPSVSSEVRPGKAIRVTADANDDRTWDNIYEGKITSAQVSYEMDKSSIVVQEEIFRTNLVINPSSASTTGYAGSNATLSVITETNGNHQIAVTPTNVSNDSYASVQGNTNAGMGAGMQAGKTYTVSANVTTPTAQTGTLNARARSIVMFWRNSAVTSNYSELQSDVGPTTGTSRVSLTFTLPANTTDAFIRLYNGSINTADVVWWDSVMLEESSTSNSFISGDVIAADNINFGYRWTGTPNASTSIYFRRGIPPTINTKITLTASDNIAALANQNETRGMGNISDLPYILEDKGVPWNINNSGNQVSSAATIAKNDNATVLDQVSITRDTKLGYAWVDRENVLNVNAISAMPSTVVAAFTDTTGLSYTGINIFFDTTQCINEVNIVWLRYDSVAGTTEEVPYGPYRNQSSIDTWGAYSSTFTIQGATESASAIAAIAQSILTANAVPVIKADALTMKVGNETEMTTASTLDLYDKVTVTFADKLTAAAYRITSIDHDITPTDWTVTLGLGTPLAVAFPRKKRAR